MANRDETQYNTEKAGSNSVSINAGYDKRVSCAPGLGILVAEDRSHTSRQNLGDAGLSPDDVIHDARLFLILMSHDVCAPAKRALI